MGMKDSVQKVIVSYCIIVSLLCIWLLHENDIKEQRLNEEMTIKYEFSSVIDSLETELHNTRHWYEENGR
jgi:hypothetical protein